MNLTDALTAIAAQLNLNAAQLIAYAAEDTIGGYPEAFSTGIFGVEGQVLYALAAYAAPATCVIMGSAGTHADDHLQKALSAYGGWWGSFEFLPDHSIDLIFEDMSGMRREVWQQAASKLAPGGFIVSHDALHPAVGGDVMRDIGAAGFSDVLTLLIEPSDCGLVIWRAPGERVEPVSNVQDKLDLIPTYSQVAVEALQGIKENVSNAGWELGHESVADVPDDLDAVVHAPVEIEELPEPAPVPKKRGRKPKVAK